MKRTTLLVPLDGSALDGSSPEALADAVARNLPEPVSDWIASGAYRRRLARVLLARRLRAMVGG